MTYDDLVKELAPLETLPADVFVGDSKVPQSVCDLVLALALVYDDFRDISAAHLLLKAVAPPRVGEVSTSTGHFGGLFTVLMRLQAGVFYELLYLLSKQKKAAQHPAFLRFIRQLDQKTTNAWKSVSSVAFNKPKNDALAKALLLLRNQVSFHYDPKALSKGLKNYLAAASGRQLFISAGGSLKRARFYFADAAAEAALVESIGEPSVKAFFTYTSPFVRDVNRLLYAVVTEFVQFRGHSFKLYAAVA